MLFECINAMQSNTKIFQVVSCIRLRYKRFDVPINFNLKILNQAYQPTHQENMIIEARKIQAKCIYGDILLYNPCCTPRRANDEGSQMKKI